MTDRLLHVGRSPAVAAAIAAAFGKKPASGPLDSIGRGDVVVVEAAAPLYSEPAVVGGNAFSACRAWKQAGAAVHVVVRADDPTGAQLARFVLADGVLVEDGGGHVHGVEALTPHDRARTRATIDALLAKYGAALRDRDASPMAKALAEWEADESLLRRLQDPETGLFDGAYAAMKIDEEWKRSQRFHLPLSLVLLDIGAAAATLPSGPDRSSVLAEVAAVFLNECRDLDVLGRFTSTTFLLLLPGTPPLGADALCRRLIAALRERTFAVPLQPAVGAVSAPMPGVTDRKDFVAIAEACLDRARAGQGVGGLVVAWE